MNGCALVRVTTIKDLGIIIDQKLAFTEHISSTFSKAFAALGFMRRNISNFDKVYALREIYCSVVRSILEYAVQVWAPYYAVNINRIERVQSLPWNNPVIFPPYADRCLLINLERLEPRRIFLQRMFIFDMLTKKSCKILFLDISGFLSTFLDILLKLLQTCLQLQTGVRTVLFF